MEDDSNLAARHLKPVNDNFGDPRSILERARRRRDDMVKAKVERLRGRSDLLFLAIEKRTAMLEAQRQLMDIAARKRTSMSRAEQELIAREMRNVMECYKAACERFDVIEAAMDEETRYKLWQQFPLT